MSILEFFNLKILSKYRGLLQNAQTCTINIFSEDHVHKTPLNKDCYLIHWAIFDYNLSLCFYKKEYLKKIIN